VRIAPSELEGLVLELEDPEGRAMAPFYEALVHTAEREAGAITRVAHYGDSSIAGDGITMTLRRRFQQRFGDAGHGFILIARGTMPYHHVDVDHTASDDWTLVQLIRSGLRDHLYGYGGVQYRGASGDSARFETSDRGPIGHTVSRFELWFQRHPRGGRVDLSVDRGERVEVSTRGEEVSDDWHVLEVPDGDHRLDLRASGGGESRLYGMVLEREGPGVVYDSLGMVGARARRMLGYDPEHFRRQHAHRGTNLIVLGFGGNDADDARTAEQFESDFRRVARMVRRARPEAACLLMAPLDQAQRDDRGAIETIDQVPIIVEAQRRAALAEGCAFFDTYGAMGGEGAMRRWYRSTPRLAFADFRHATPEGYRVIGNMLYKALLKGFADYLERQGQPAQGQPAQGPPAQGPPAQGPPAQGPPAQGPPAQGPPAQGQPAQGRPARARSGEAGPAAPAPPAVTPPTAR
jgi:lysophospholipase L1-like esterase